MQLLFLLYMKLKNVEVKGIPRFITAYRALTVKISPNLMVLNVMSGGLAVFSPLEAGS